MRALAVSYCPIIADIRMQIKAIKGIFLKTLSDNVENISVKQNTSHAS